MHKVMEELQAIRVRTTLENLRRNNMEAVYAETAADALALLKSYLTPGCTVGVGGSVTLDEIGAIDLLRSGDYDFLDRYAPGLTPVQMKDIFRRSLLSDVYVMSANAITENGELYNVDGRANRVAAMLFGPESVVVIAGYNKIVKDLAEADLRVRTIAAPMNCVRLKRETPCTKIGTCADCRSEGRICADRVVMARQMVKDRVKVILVREELGY